MAPELAPNQGWLNTDRPLSLHRDLKGHVVLLDFWTYCCINCMHILPDLEYLEDKYADEPFVVVGVHSAKFTNEDSRESIRQAIERYHIRHPVVIDEDMAIWRAYGARGWPTFVLIGPDGRIVGSVSGEGAREVLDAAIQRTLEEGRRAGTLAATPLKITPSPALVAASGLRFPGKVLAVRDSDGQGLLFVSDSTNNRVIAATLPDETGRSRALLVAGTGERGLRDGPAEQAQLRNPQGLAWDAASRTLYIADTDNHAIRALRLDERIVETVAGTGAISYDRRGGGAGTAQGLNSPWDLALAPDNRTLYVAMAGLHQLWAVDLQTRTARAVAGSGAENLHDGPASSAALAQPSGLALSRDGSTLYFADAEVSAVRALDLAAGAVRTIVGEGLFDFGDVDGAAPHARLQHPLGVALWPGVEQGSDALFVADTYNHKVKVVDPKARTATTLLGSGRSQLEPDALTLDEPGGLSFLPDPEAPTVGGRAGGALHIADTNHHRVVVVDVATRAWREIAFDDLPRAGAARSFDWDDAGVLRSELAIDPKAPLALTLDVTPPPGRKVNPEAPLSVRVLRTTPSARSPAVVAQRTARLEAFPFTLKIPAGALAAQGELLVEAFFASCAEDESVCLPEEVRWRVALKPGNAARATLRADLSQPIRTGLGKPGGR